MSIPEKALRICRTLRSRGFEAYLVGGAVRDHLLGRSVHDWDLATDATPDQIRSCFSNTLDIGAQYGTVTVRLERENFEITTYRAEGTYSDGRRPDSVQFSTSIVEDLSRRDFTINAIAYDPLEGAYCDPHKGCRDLKNGLLRTVGNPLERFQEDGLRLMRAIRFVATHNLMMADSTRIALAHALPSLAKVSRERIRDELLKILGSVEPSKAFNIMAQSGMLGVVLPEMVPMVGCTQNQYHEFDVWGHTIKVVDWCPLTDVGLRLAALFHDIGKPSTRKKHPTTGDWTFYDHEDVGEVMTQNVMTRLRFPSAITNRVSHLVRHHFVRYTSEWTDSAVRRWMRTVGVEHIPSLISLATADILGKGNSRFVLDTAILEELRHRIDSIGTIPTSSNCLAVDGGQIMATLSIPPGPKVGRILAELLERVTEDPSLNTQESLTRLIPEVAAMV